MKKLSIFLTVFALLALASTGLAAKPDNTPGAVKYGWNLSAAVMPVPPYGSADIPGSDTASKLIANYPNGVNPMMLSGNMAGLAPNTTYTVYVSKSYTPYTPASIAGDWTIAFQYGGSYVHKAHFDQTGNTVTGTGGYPATGTTQYEWQVTSGTVTGNNVDLTMVYTKGTDALTPLTTMHMAGTIASNGTMSGTWSDNYQGGTRNGTWSSASGTAAIASGSTYWPGMLNGLTPFTFTTDSTGAGNWHINLSPTDIAGASELSVWINGGVTILVSDNIPTK